MPQLLDLGVKIGDSVSFPIGTKEGVVRHIARIVGPPEFPHSDVVYLHPPEPEGRGNIWVYNPKTKTKRSTEKRSGKEDQDGHPLWEEWPSGPGEIKIQSIHMGYTLFEAAQG